MSMGQAFAEVLPPSHRRALSEACDVVLDALLDDTAEAETKQWDVGESFVAHALPRRYILKYQSGFVRRFLATLTTVAWKLNQRRFIPFACVAEELAAWVIIETAGSILEEHGFTTNFDRLVSRAFQDTDFLNLYDAEMDGIDESPLAQVMGMTSLRFEDWFAPFNADDEFGAAHPYGQGDDAWTNAELSASGDESEGDED